MQAPQCARQTSHLVLWISVFYCTPAGWRGGAVAIRRLNSLNDYLPRGIYGNSEDLGLYVYSFWRNKSGMLLKHIHFLTARGLLLILSIFLSSKKWFCGHSSSPVVYSITWGGDFELVIAITQWKWVYSHPTPCICSCFHQRKLSSLGQRSWKVLNPYQGQAKVTK